MKSTSRGKRRPFTDRHGSWALVGSLIWIAGLVASCSTSRFPEPLPGRAFAFVHGTIIDGTGADPISDGVIVFRDSEIIHIGPAAGWKAESGCKTTNVRGNWIVPGIINAHIHLRKAEELASFAAAGVTTVRDMAARGEDMYARRNQLNGDPRNARLVCATPILTVPGGYGTSSFTTPEEAAEAVARHVAAGAEIVKFSLEDYQQGRSWHMPSREQILYLTAAARALNRRTSVHLSWTRNIDLAIEARVDEFAHMAVDTVADQKMERIVKAGIVWIPTLELWNGVASTHGSKWITVPLDNLRRFRSAGGRVVLGTDFNGYTTPFELGIPLTEFRLMTEAGMSPMEIIVASTSTAAEACGLSGITGRLEKGLQADFLVLGADPLADIGNFSKVEAVYRGGVPVSPVR